MGFSGREVTNKGFVQGWDPDAQDQASQRALRNVQLLEALVLASWGWDRFNSIDLTYAYRGGVIDDGANWTVIANGAVSLADDATNFVERSDVGVVTVNQVDFDHGKVPMAEVTTRLGAIVDVIDRRPFAGGSGGGGGGGGPISFPDILGQILDHQVPLSAVKQWESFLSIGMNQLTGDTLVVDFIEPLTASGVQVDGLLIRNEQIPDIEAHLKLARL